MMKKVKYIEQNILYRLIAKSISNIIANFRFEIHLGVVVGAARVKVPFNPKVTFWTKS